MKGKTLFTIFILFFLGLLKSYWLLPRSMFEADQEYLALSGRAILNKQFTLIGAPTSVGGMFIGPLYNYLVAGALWIFRGNPLVINGLSDFWVAAIIPVLYIVGRKIYSERAALLAAIVALFSVNFIDQAEVPPLLFPLPIISLVFLAIVKSPISRIRKSLLLGSLAGLSSHLHFSGIFFIPLLFAVGWSWIIPLFILLSPLFLFDLRHNFFIVRHAFQFLQSTSDSGSLINYRIDTYVGGILNLLSPIKISHGLAFVFLLAAFGWLLRQKKYWEFILFILPLIFFLIYPGHLLPYYSIIAWPIFFLTLGLFLDLTWKVGEEKLKKSIRGDMSFLVPIGIISLLVAYSLPNFKQWIGWESGRGIDKKIAALRFIKERAKEKPFYLSKTIEPAADFGFTYLIDYIGLVSSGNLKDPNYTIVAPFNWRGIQPDVRFGDIGVILPKK